MSHSPLACLYDRRFEWGGDANTVNVAGFTQITQTNETVFEAVAGPSYRQIVDLHNLQTSVFVLPGGQSGNVLDLNYDNMLPLWQADEYIPMQTQNYKVKQSLSLKTDG